MSSDATRLPAPPESRGMPTWAKFLLGIGAGCLVVALLGVAACGVAFWWAFAPGEQAAPETFIDDRTVGVVGTTSLARDPGTAELIAHVVAEMQRVTWESIPDDSVPTMARWARKIQERQIEALRGSGGIGSDIPRDIVVLLQRRPEDEPAWLAIVNLAKGPRLYGLLVGWMARQAGDDVATVKYRGETIINFEHGTFLCFLDSTLLVSDDLDAVKRAIDGRRDPRDEQPAEAGPWTRYGAMAERWDLFAVLDNVSGDASDGLGSVAEVVLSTGAEAIEGLPDDIGLPELPEQDLMDEIRYAEIGVDIVSAARTRIEADLELRSEAAAAALAERWAGDLAARTEAGREHGLDIVPEIERSGRSVRLRIDLGGVDRAITSWLERNFPRHKRGSRLDNRPPGP